MSGMCPHCGYNLEADAPIVRGKWRLEPNSCRYGRTTISLTPVEAGVLYAIAKGAGGWVKAEAIQNRVTDAEGGKIVAVMVYRIRKKLGAKCPIEGSRGRSGRGYRWAA